MKRRTVIASAAALAGALGGCTGLDGSAGDGGDGSPSPSASPSPTPVPTESPTPTQPSTPTRTATPTPTPGAITGTSFEVVENTCGTGRDEASVERGSGRVTVRGTVSGRNGCFTAELASAGYDADAGELTVAVRSFSEASAGEGCTQCLVDIDYRAEVTYDAPDPETVTVLHNGEPVSTTEG